MKKWKTKDGREIKPSEMTDSHILNAYKMLRRRGFIGKEELDLFLMTPPPRGDMARLSWSREIDKALQSPVTQFIDIFKNEMDKRNIEY